MAPAAQAPAKSKARPTQPPKSVAATAEGREAPPIPQAEIEQLLESWLEAQNEREFEAYQALYAEKFFGLRRSGHRTYTYDRDGWLEDRRRIFKRRLKVELKDLRTQAGASAATVVFEQRRSSRRSRDRAHTRMVLVREGQQLRIASEVALNPHFARAAKARELRAPRFMFALEAGGRYLVLDPQADASVGQGPPRVVDDDGVVSVAREIDPKSLREEFEGLSGLPVHLYSSGGVACQGKLGDPLLMRRVVPHFRTRAAFEGKDGPTPSRAEIARQAWALSSAQTLLVARLEQPKGSCRGALWGRSSKLRSPRIYLGARSNHEVSAQIGAEVRKLRAYKRLQKEFRRSGAGTRAQPWDRHAGASPSFRSWRADRREVHTYSARAGAGCGGFEGGTWALYEDLAGQLARHTDARQPGQVRPLAVFDLEHNGLVEVLGAPELHGDGPARLFRQRADTGIEFVMSVEPAFLDSGC